MSVAALTAILNCHPRPDAAQRREGKRRHTRSSVCWIHNVGRRS